MKKIISALIAVLMMLSFVGCAEKKPDKDTCPGKDVGGDGVPTVQVEGFDTSVDMSFKTHDTNGNPVTNEIFAGSKRGVWLVFWRTDSGRSAEELARLQRMLPTANKYGYKIVGIVMDGESNKEKAREMTAGLDFFNILWNDEVASRYEGIPAFFTKEFINENKAMFEELPIKPELGSPVTTYANSRGQIQSSCNFVPLSNERLESMWKNNDANMTFEEFKKQNDDVINNQGN